MRWLVLAAAGVLLATADPGWKTPQPECHTYENCSPPDCRCASTMNPIEDNGETPYLPQFVVLSFDDAVKVDNIDFYQSLLDKYKMPNGCPITTTFFITHMYNDYAITNELYRQGCEIAAHSVSHKPDVENYWRPMGYDGWLKEINDTKQMIHKYGKIPLEAIKGWRAPFLESGGDDMFQALQDCGFTYDCSISTYRYSNWYQIAGEHEVRHALFPYTMDFESDLQCSVGTCPAQTYPGFWVTPMTDLNDPRSWTMMEDPAVRAPCNMLGSCVGGNETDTEWDCPQKKCKDNMVTWLKNSFHNHYDNNRAPFGLYTHYAWLQNDDISNTKRKEAYTEFLDYIQTIDDVWIVSLETVIEWMKDPQYHEDMVNDDWEPAHCDIVLPITNCPDPITCVYENPPIDAALDKVVMKICTRPCPENYPWIDNIDGN